MSTSGNMSNVSEQAAMFYVVEYTERRIGGGASGWRAACGFSFATEAEAREWRDKNVPSAKISRRFPGYVGDAINHLNNSDLID